ncbi:protein-disulfide reductase DsbD family protein [Maridesulfovibrio hydrothermalis]|uniref:Cytochrome c biogenesis protein transmembrane region n=1 Tax=Maridesulfovibrio hydrothermalis AM13 = DSM 14728 TaxID=1121451 RepID=L0RDR7_9BACT|nr:cytochrome c biogenesis protein CcdA [Maridesulfovibrio hydrothermalis]CCO24898.1 Cytochrome c biogenesis protein transmembrane region [Maridesulfovibrio hydrothermalis AM13 = DSM 14728]
MRLKLLFLFFFSFLLSIGAIYPQTALTAQNKNPNLSTTWKLYRLNLEDQATVSLQTDVLAALILETKNGWYTYSHKPGKMGQPTTLKASFMPGNIVLTPLYLPGKLKDDPFNKGSKIGTYSDPTPIFIPVPSTSKSFTLKTQLSLLMCSPTACQPFKADLNFLGMVVSPDKLPEANAQAWWPQFVKSRSGADKGKISLKNITAQIKAGAKQTVKAELEKESPALSTETVAPVTGKMPAPQPAQGFSLTDLKPQSFTPGLEVTDLTTAILFGLLAGFLLNFMPCVLPVISLKLSTLLAGAQHSSADEQKRSFREHNIFFALGILLYFGLLSGILGFTGMAWGQIFQKPPIVIGLTGIVFALSLSLFGLFNLPVVDLKIDSHTTGPRRQALFTGILATLLATPCSGPFLGGVLGWAMVQQHYVISSVFLSVGAGMALPYLIMAVFPALATKFPKPGAWTVWIERAAGFFLAGTCIYLLSILPENMFIPTLIFMWFTSVAAWMWGLAAGSDSKGGMYLLRIAALCLCLAAGFWASTPPVRTAHWINFQQEDFTARLGKEPMLVEFTADWCPSCKVLEQTTLTPTNLNRWQEKYGLVYIKVDLTSPDKSADAFLRALGSSSIPLAAIFNTGEDSKSPTVIRDLYTTGQMDDALEQTLK